MPTNLHLSSTEFATHLTPGQLRTGMIIQVALVLGSLSFLMVVLLLTFTGRQQPANPGLLDMLTTFTIANLIAFVVFAGIGNLLYRSRLRPARLQSEFEGESPDRRGNLVGGALVDKVIGIIRSAMILRTALLEAAAFLGLMVLMFAATEGVLLSTQWLWLNLIPVAGLCIFVASTFPTAGRLQHIYETHFLHTSHAS
jgi:hypothetical protein